jgi:hypothetical protein
MRNANRKFAAKSVGKDKAQVQITLKFTLQKQGQNL